MLEVKYNNNNLAKNESNWWYILTDIDWRNVITKDKTANLMWSHWSFSWPTYARYRLITLAWIIAWESRSELQDYIDEIASIFDIPLNLNNTEKKFEITDLWWNTWHINARVQSPVVFEYDDDWFDAVKFRVSLFCKDPLYLEDYLNEYIGQEWIMFWFILNQKIETWIYWMKLGKVFDDQWLWVTLISTGNVWSRLIITIDILWAIDTPKFRVTNLNNDKFFWLENISLNPWDQIIIDGLNQTAKKNWENILANREPWSSWLEAYKTQTFLAFDADIERDFNIKYEFYNTLL